MNTITKSLGLTLLAGSLMFTACNNGNDTSTTTKDSSATATDTKAMGAAQPNTDTGSNANANNNMSANKMSDADFVMKASAINMAEIEAHKAAQTHATSADVKAHAKHMLTDHTKMGNDMKALASKKNWTLATAPDAAKKQSLDDMNANKKGKDWDNAYLDAQENDHKEVISMFENAQNSVQDADLKALITQALPQLRSHLQMVQDAKSKMK